MQALPKRPRPQYSQTDNAQEQKVDRGSEEDACSEEAVSEEACSEEACSEEACSEEAGSEEAGSEEASSEKEGSEEEGSEDRGSEEEGSEEEGIENRGSEEEGSAEVMGDDGLGSGLRGRLRRYAVKHNYDVKGLAKRMATVNGTPGHDHSLITRWLHRRGKKSGSAGTQALAKFDRRVSIFLAQEAKGTPPTVPDNRLRKHSRLKVWQLAAARQEASASQQAETSTGEPPQRDWSRVISRVNMGKRPHWTPWWASRQQADVDNETVGHTAGLPTLERWSWARKLPDEVGPAGSRSV